MCNNWSNRTIPNSIVQTWGFPNQSYVSQFDYNMDPIFVNPNSYKPVDVVQRIDNQRGLLLPPTHYSTENRAYQPVIPYNVVPRYSPTNEFDIKILGQTDACEVISWRNQNPFGAVSLAKVVNSVISKMGALQTKFGRVLGTCTLISDNLVMTARHVIEEEVIGDLVVRFDYIRAQNHVDFQSFPIALDCVVEDDPEYDYAIIKLKVPRGVFEYVNLNIGDPFPGETALLHYPLEKKLKVSVHTFDNQASQYSQYIRCFHDSDYCSSGGAYFDPLGHFTAMHIGSEFASDGFTLSRYAIKLQDIVKRNPNSLLANPANGIRFRKIYLAPYSRSFSIDEEGIKSQSMFTDLLKNALKVDKKISLTKAKIVAFSDKNLNHLTAKYPRIFKTVYNKCLYLTGLHAYTKQYAIKKYIESDHIIPHHVWASTTLPSMRTVVKGGGKRPGENDMPAITIPYAIHRNLRTTGGVQGYKIFHQKLIKICDDDKVHKAFIKCLKEYQKNGIDVTNNKVKKAIIKCLDAHIAIGVIDKLKRHTIISVLP